MNDLTPTFSVVIRSDIPRLERELLQQFCCKITSDQEGELLHFLCTKIDVSHHSYIEMQTYTPKGQALYCVKIPHHYVFLIDGSKEHPSIGFQREVVET